eukprot:2929104-Alexandrium_andersonii.AAC.1
MVQRIAFTVNDHRMVSLHACVCSARNPMAVFRHCVWPHVGCGWAILSQSLAESGRSDTNQRSVVAP